MSKSVEARNCFGEGYNCCQAVLTTFCDELGLNKEAAMKIATGMGGGVRKGDVCGAVTGGAMVIGLKYGVDGQDQDEKKLKCHGLTESFQEKFTEIYKSIQCRDILGYDLTIEEEMAAIKEKALFTQVCPQVVEDAAAIIEQMLAENPA